MKQMDRELYLKISKWRDDTAKNERVESYRVISTQAIEGIATSKPGTKEELLLVKGIAEKKFAKYGLELLALIAEHEGLSQEVGVSEESQVASSEKIFSVSDFLELINIGLRRSEAKVRGEISSLDIRERYLFFSLKDANDGALLNVMMWRNDYVLSGVELAEGMEVCVTGYPEIYKPAGRFSFHALSVELFGEGALKKAYNALKKKLELEGLFSVEKKKMLPEYPQNIGVITSKTGAVIHDFLNNIGKFGYKIEFYDSRVEGQLAVRDLVAGVKYFKKRKGDSVDVLVIMRGGGSLESLQAFNNEALVREIADCPFPTVAAIGHDKDVPLISLCADQMVSTPTAAAKLLDESYRDARAKVRLSEEKMLMCFREAVGNKKHLLSRYSGSLTDGISKILEKVKKIERVFEHSSAKLGFALKSSLQILEDRKRSIVKQFEVVLDKTKSKIAEGEQSLRMNSPKRQLRLGYSIAMAGGKVIRNLEQVKEGDIVETHVADGTFRSKVEEKKKSREV